MSKVAKNDSDTHTKRKETTTKNSFYVQNFSQQTKPNYCMCILPSPFPWLTGSASLDETEYFILLQKNQLKKKRNHVLLKDENAVKNIWGLYWHKHKFTEHLHRSRAWSENRGRKSGRHKKWITYSTSVCEHKKGTGCQKTSLLMWMLGEVAEV